MATGIQRTGQNTFFDVAVVDTGAKSYRAMTVLRDKEQRKTDKYEERAEMMGGTFVPLVCSVYGTLAPESVTTLTKVLGELNEDTPEKRCTSKMHRVALQVAILKVTSLCLRTRYHIIPLLVCVAQVVVGDGEGCQPCRRPAACASLYAFLDLVWGR